MTFVKRNDKERWASFKEVSGDSDDYFSFQHTDFAASVGHSKGEV